MESRRRIMLLSQNVFLNFVPFVAPADFNPNAQEFNIYNAYNEFINSNKKLIFYVGSAYATTVVAASTGRSYYYGQDISGEITYSTISSGTITWTSGSTKRHIFVIDTNLTITYTVPASAIWLYYGDKVTSIGHFNQKTLKYIHSYSDATITGFGTNAFYDDANLTGILSLSQSLTSIGSGCFYNCVGLTGQLKIPNAIITIGSSTFEGCSGFSSILFNNAITSIGDYAFRGCKFNQVLSLPTTLTSIGYQSFSGCNLLNGDLIFPQGLIYIGGAAFINCSGLNGRVVIPISVSSIGNTAFGSCPNIQSIYNYASTPQNIAGGIVSAAVLSRPLHIPIGTTAAYRSNTYWNSFTNIIDDL